MERNLIDYLPEVIREFREFKGITAGQQPEFEQTWDSTDAVMNNQFIITAGNLGISRWERILGIVPKGTDTIEDRRATVLSRLNQNFPLTFLGMMKWLETMCKGAALHMDGYTLQITLPISANYMQILDAVLQRIPANLLVALKIVANPQRIPTFTGIAVREGKRTSIGCVIPSEQDVRYLADENGSILTDEAGRALLVRR